MTPIHAPISALGEESRPPTYHASATLAFPRTTTYAESIEPPPPSRRIDEILLGLAWALMLAVFGWAAYQGYVFGPMQ